MKVYIALAVVVAVVAADPDPAMQQEWRADYGRYGVESVLPLRVAPPLYYPDTIKQRALVYPDTIKQRALVYPDTIKQRALVYPHYKTGYPYAYRAAYDPENFYNTFGFYPDH